MNVKIRDGEGLIDVNRDPTTHPNPPPRYIYFYYLKQDGDHIGLRVYFIDQGRSTRLTQEMVENLVDQADHNRLPVRGSRVSDLVWRQRSYLVFVLRDPEFRLEGVGFEMLYPEEGWDHPFSDHQVIKRPIDRDISGTWCINQRTNRHGDPLGEDDNEIFRVKFIGLPERAHNEAGSNTGP